MMQITGNAPVSGIGTSQKADPALEKTAKAFEAIFIRQMIGAMRSASLSDGMFDSGATEQFRDMADSRTAENMAQQGAMGIAELLLKQLTPLTQTQVQTLAQDQTSATSAKEGDA